MILLSNILPADGPATDYVATINALDAIFAGNWRAKFDEIAALVVELKKNNTLLREFLRRVAQNEAWPRLTGAQSFEIFSSKNLFIRLNLWFPQRIDQSYRSQEFASYLSIEEPHNHSFSFFTTTMVGPGYESIFFDVPDVAAELSAGDAITVTNMRRVELKDDIVMFVERDLDFHTQLWPSDMTLTLNLIPLHRSEIGTRQYMVDLNRREVSRVIINAI